MLEANEVTLITDGLKGVNKAMFDLSCAGEHINDAMNIIYERSNTVDDLDERTKLEEAGGDWEIAEQSLDSLIHELRAWLIAASKVASCPAVQEVLDML